MKNKILIFTPTYNEFKNISEFIKCIDELNIEADILIVDDNSPDNTWKIVQDYERERENLHLIKREKKEGVDTAHKIAYSYAVKNNYTYLITLDSDLSHDPRLIPKFIEELKTNIFVIGSRYIKGGKCGMTGWRLFLSYFGNKFFKFIFNIDCDEYTSSFRGFSLKKLKDFDLKNIKSKGYSFFMETIYLINKKNIYIKQIPISAKQRYGGKSKIERIEILRTLVNVFRLKFNL